MSDSIAYAFSILILVWLFLATLAVVSAPLARRDSASKFIAITPNSLATLGVLGTFTGILIGLIDFDVTRVDDSVPQLLAGLKIAFTTSIVGIAAAIFFRLVRTVAPSVSTTDGVTADDIHRVLVELRDEARTASARSAEQLAQVRSAISSEGDSSLLTQLQKLRSTVQDGQNDLIKEFRQFAAHMVENNQKAIIEALEAVIRDFNHNLTEQFGDNFKELNAAVYSLVEWQDNYKEHVDALGERLKQAVDAVEASRVALEHVKSYAEKIPPAIQKLEPALNGINSQTELMAAHLEAIGALRDRAIEAFPVVEANLEKITNQLAASVETAVQKSTRSLAEADAAHAKLAEGYQRLLQRANESGDHFSAALATALKQMNEQATREFARHGDLIESAAREAQKSINESWARSAEKMNEQFENFDKQMQQELTRALQSLGRNLASVSEKFVSDYTPLTERLRDLLRAVGSVR